MLQLATDFADERGLEPALDPRSSAKSVAKNALLLDFHTREIRGKRFSRVNISFVEADR
ncbi:MAG: hypothetical protein ACT4PG_03260 [Panacagrimonas sp.]